MMMSEVLAGHISSCSIVPASRSFTMAVAGHDRAVQDNQQAEDAGHDEPGSHQAGVIQESGRQHHLPFATHHRRGHLPELRVHAATGKPHVVGLDHALGHNPGR